MAGKNMHSNLMSPYRLKHYSQPELDREVTNPLLPGPGRWV